MKSSTFLAVTTVLFIAITHLVVNAAQMTSSHKPAIIELDRLEKNRMDPQSTKKIQDHLLVSANFKTVDVDDDTPIPKQGDQKEKATVIPPVPPKDMVTRVTNVLTESGINAAIKEFDLLVKEQKKDSNTSKIRPEQLKRIKAKLLELAKSENKGEAQDCLHGFKSMGYLTHNIKTELDKGNISKEQYKEKMEIANLQHAFLVNLCDK